jgi:hypothetical protein
MSRGTGLFHAYAGQGHHVGQDSFDPLRPYISYPRLRDLHRSLRQGGRVKESGKKIGWNTARDFCLLAPSAR